MIERSEIPAGCFCCGKSNSSAGSFAHPKTIFMMLVGIFVFSWGLSSIYGPIATVAAWLFIPLIAVFEPILTRKRKFILLALPLALMQYTFFQGFMVFMSGLGIDPLELLGYPVLVLEMVLLPEALYLIIITAMWFIGKLLVRHFKIREKVGKVVLN